MGKVLLIEDSDDLRFSLSNVVKKEGYTIFTAPSGSEAVEILNSQIIDLVFLDIGLPDIDGIQLIHKIRNLTSDIDIVMLTGMNDAQTAVNALKAGAIDYIVKPFDIMQFKNILHRIMKDRITIKQSMLEFKDKGIDNIIGECKEMMRLKEEIRMVAEVKSPVLIRGVTGTGKELVARAIYNVPAHKNGIFVKVDCGTLSSNIIESELFGHEKGAFTDAKKDKKGLVEMADGGTLFLDEIGNLPLELQPKLLRLIEEGTFRRVGGLQDKHVNVRIIAATNINIDDEVKQGKFREDLYFRIKVVTLTIPPLRERGDDIVLLAEYLLKQFNHELKKKIKGFTPQAVHALSTYSWPGNIRELKNCIERAVIYCRSFWITPQDLNIEASVERDALPSNTSVTLEQMEREYIKKVLGSVNNNKTLAAKILGISRTTLREKLKGEQFLTN